MTDARFPERWLNDKRIVRLSDSAFRTFVLGMTFSVANRTDGYLEHDDLPLIHGANPDAADELMQAGLWSKADDVAYMIEDFAKTQTSAAQLDGLDRKRQQDAARSKRYRDKKKADPDTDPPPSRDSSRDDIGQARTGQAGQALSTREVPTTGGRHADGVDSSSSEPCFSCGIRPAVNGSDCLECSSGGSDLQHHSVSEPTTPRLTETRVSPDADRNADRIAPESPSDRPATAHRAPTVPTSCAFGPCTESARPGKQMCGLHFTYEPSRPAA